MTCLTTCTQKAVVIGSEEIADASHTLFPLSNLYGGLAKCLAVSEKVNAKVTSYIVLVDASRSQKLHLFRDGWWLKSYKISTSAKGNGQKTDSEQTPLGLHRIEEKIGNFAKPFEIFEARRSIGRVWSEGNFSGDVIVGRILWLKGLESGFNSRGDVDSYARYVYIHGTNRTDLLGVPSSGGCIRMSPNDIIDLYKKVSAGTLVYIYE